MLDYSYNSYVITPSDVCDVGGCPNRVYQGEFTLVQLPKDRYLFVCSPCFASIFQADDNGE